MQRDFDTRLGFLNRAPATRWDLHGALLKSYRKIPGLLWQLPGYLATLTASFTTFAFYA